MKKSSCFSRSSFSLCSPYGNRKGGLSEAKVKTCRWHVFSPWEIPAGFRTQSVGLWAEIGIFSRPIRASELFSCRSGIERAAPVRTLVQKQSGGHNGAPQRRMVFVGRGGARPAGGCSPKENGTLQPLLPRPIRASELFSCPYGNRKAPFDEGDK